MGDTWQKLGVVTGKDSNLQIETEEEKTLIELSVAEMTITWGNAIPGRLH